MKPFKPLYTTDRTYVMCRSGRLGGKTVAIAQYVAIKFLNEDGDILVGRSNYADIKKSVFQEIINIIDELGFYHILEIKQKPLEIHNQINGNIINFVGIGGSDEHRTKGFKPKKRLSVIVMEELQQVPKQTNLDAAMDTFLRYLKDDGKVIYMFNPDRRSSHWLNGYYRDKQHEDDYLCIETSYKNIAKELTKHVIKRILLEKKTNPSNYRYTYLGETEGLFGAVYYNFDRNTHLINETTVKMLIKKIGAQRLLIGADPASTIDKTAFIPILLLRNGQTIALNYFYHDPQRDGQVTNDRLIPYLQKWLQDLHKRWGLNDRAPIDVIFDMDAHSRDLRGVFQYRMPSNYSTRTFTSKDVITMTHAVQNAFSRNVLYILDEGGYYNYITNRFMKAQHPLVTQLEQVMWNEAGDGLDKKIDNDLTDALSYVISHYFKNPENLYNEPSYFYKPFKVKEGEVVYE